MAINQIKKFREQKRPFMSQWKLALKVGVTQSMVTIWESGYREPTGKQKVKIAKALELSMIDIFPPESEF
jgi:DNA-binding XRE family transcriptional regulator